MRADGTILGRYFCKLPKEYDSLMYAVNRIKKAQQHGNRRMSRLWAKAKGINRDISVKTANFIMNIAVLYNADAIVFGHLDRTGKKRGSKKQRLHLWRRQYVQSMVTDKAHRIGMRISRICAWGPAGLLLMAAAGFCGVRKPSFLPTVCAGSKTARSITATCPLPIISVAGISFGKS